MTAMILIASALSVAGPIAIGGLEASEHSAVRSFSSERVPPGGDMTVTITAQDYGPFAQVVETLPEGFRFLGASLSDAAVRATDNTVRFTLLGEEQFTYTSAAPAVGGEYDFSGFLLDSNRNERAIGGSIILMVEAAPKPTPEPTPTLTPTLEPTASPTPEPTSAPEPKATTMPEPTSTPAATATPTPEPTSAPEPSATPTPEPNPCTQTYRNA